MSEQELRFGEVPDEYAGENEAQIVILPIPYDGTSTWLKGADKGPAAIIDASSAMWYYDIETNTEVYKKGIYTAPPVSENRSPELMVEQACQRTREYLEKEKFLVTLGGEHSVSIGVMKAFSEKFDDLTILQFDAHLDLMQVYEGSANNHACVMARAKEHSQVIQVGIRSVDIAEYEDSVPRRVFYAHDICDNDEWMDQVVSLLTKNLYITFDLDAFDPSLLPATGTPEPGGMGWYQVMKLLKKVVGAADLKGFDVVELCPRQGDRTSDYIAAKLIYKLLSYKFADK